MRGYQRATARADGIAGLTVAVLLVPQAMAYAALAGLPPVVGLYAATLPLVAYALLGTSAQLAVGPVAIVALLAGSAIAPIADSASEAAALAALLAVMVGVLQVALAVLRLQRVVDLLTHGVVVGFTSAAAIVIALAQVPGLLGMPNSAAGTALAAASAIVSGMPSADLLTAVIGVGGAVLLLASRALFPRVPGPLLLLVGAVGASVAFGLAGRGVEVVGEIPAGLPVPAFPQVAMSAVLGLLPAAAAIAFIGFAEGWSVARALARGTDTQPRAARELVAVGCANIASGAVSGMPVAGGFSRTAVNYEAGARTPAASLVTAAVIALVAMLATSLLEPLPRAALSAVIVVAVLRLVDLAEIRRLLRQQPADGAVAGVTFAAVLGVGVEAGLGIGVVAALLVRLDAWRRTRRRTSKTAGDATSRTA